MVATSIRQIAPHTKVLFNRTFRLLYQRDLTKNVDQLRWLGSPSPPQGIYVVCSILPFNSEGGAIDHPTSSHDPKNPAAWRKFLTLESDFAKKIPGDENAGRVPVSLVRRGIVRKSRWRTIDVTRDKVYRHEK
jgi:hypothetical protein